jgi:peptidyl-prolyl cis-trans isomerase SurA
MTKAKTMTRWLGLLGVTGLLWAVPVQAELVDRVAAVVNEDIISFSEVEQRAAPELARLQATERDPVKRTEGRAHAQKEALDQLIGEKLMETQMRELAIEVSDSEIDLGIEDVRKQNNIDGDQFEQLLRNEGYTVAGYRDFMRKHLARLKLINLKVRNKVKVSDDDLKAEYVRWSNTESGDAEIHARHILVQLPSKPTQEQVEKAKLKATALMEEAKRPGVDFAELAKKKSEGPSASEGGDLGFFRRGLMVPEFEKIAFNLKTGDISEPVRTKFGFHVIKIEERRNVAVKSFDEVKEQLREKLMRSQLERYTDQYVQELRQKATIEVKI